MVQGDNSGESRRWMLVLGAVLAGVMFFYPLLLGTPLLDPDEGLHASIAQEMVEQGDWVTPRLFGKPFLDKPILYFWAEALSLRTFGMHEAAVRFPGLMFGLLGAVTTGIVGWRMLGRTVGLVAGLFYATMILPTALAQAPAHDVALIPWVNLALLLFWESDRAVGWRAALGYSLATGLFLGLASLTKGLVGVAMVGLSYGCYLLITRRLTVGACVRGAAALGVAALVASTWYIAVEIGNPGYLYYFFVERHLLGYATSTQSHGHESWWYYLPILLGGGLPWIAYLPVVVQDGWARRKKGTGPICRNGPKGAAHKLDLSRCGPPNGAMVLLWCWLIGCTLLLSLSRSKLVTYIWPVFPAVAILAAVAWGRLIEGWLSQGARRALSRTVWLSSMGGPAVLPVVMIVVQSEFAVRFRWPVWAAGILAAAVSLAPLGFWVAGRIRAALCSAVLSTAVQFAVIMAAVLPPVAAATSARDLASHFNRLGRLPPQLLVAEERIGSIVFYLDRDLRVGLQEGQLRYLRSGELPQPKPGAVVALPEQRVDRVGRYYDLTGVGYQRVGRYRLYDATALEFRPLTATAGSAVTRQ